MKYISLTFKNIRKFIIYHPIIFILFIIVQIICCIGTFITCGMANNMYYMNEKLDKYSTFKFNLETNRLENNKNFQQIFAKNDDGNTIIFYLPKGEKDVDDKSKRIYQLEHNGVVHMPEMRKKIDVLLEDLDKYDIAMISMFLYYSEVTDTRKLADFSFFTVYPGENMNENFYIDKIYVNSNEKIILAPTLTNNLGYKVGQIYNINGYDYKCVAESKNFNFIPYNALDDSFVTYLVHISFENKLTQTNINEIAEKINSVFEITLENNNMPEPYNLVEIQLNQMVYVISLVVMVIILLAIAKFYNYVLSDRKNTLTILRLCGCTRRKVHIIYMLEIFLTMIVTSAIGFVLFKFVFFKGIAELYPSFKDFYTDIIYIAVLGTYIVLAMIIMAFTIIPSTKATITDMKRKV